MSLRAAGLSASEELTGEAEHAAIASLLKVSLIGWISLEIAEVWLFVSFGRSGTRELVAETTLFSVSSVESLPNIFRLLLRRSNQIVLWLFFTSFHYAVGILWLSDELPSGRDARHPWMIFVSARPSLFDAF